MLANLIGNKLQHLLLHPSDKRSITIPQERDSFTQSREGNTLHTGDALMMHRTATLWERRSTSHSDVDLGKKEEKESFQNGPYV
jgi:hypothetical protein